MFLFAILAFSCACSPRILEKPYNETLVRQLYNASIADASFPEASEISSNLVVITPQNDKLKWKKIDGKDHVLVSTWISDSTFYGQIKPGMPKFEIDSFHIVWVTAIPEMQDVCQEPKFGRKEGLNLRLKQVLGMPPTSKKSHFAELWVQPQHLYRPCPDKEINDSNCGLYFSEQDTTQVIWKPYVEWFNDQRLMSYYNYEWKPEYSWTDHYPWTQLGYTYDWNKKNKTHVGLSEFIIYNNAPVYPHQVYTTEEYCTP